MEDSAILERIKELAAPLLSEAGVELVDLTYRGESGGMTLRFTVDKADGISIGECGRLSRKIEAAIDGANIIEDRYMLEVQSPGLDRKLVKTSDFERAISREIAVYTRNPVNGKMEFIGKLKWVGEESLKLEMPAGNEIEIPRDLISKSKIHFEF